MKLRSFRVDRQQYLLSRAASARNVLHIGCTNSPNTHSRWESGLLLHQHLCSQGRRLGQNIVGLDIDVGAVEWLREKMPNERIVCGDAHHLDETLPGEFFDLILAGDVIEHLPDPGRFLRACLKALSRDGTVVVSTINTFGIVRFAKACFGHEAVHDEHTSYYSVSTMDRLAKVTGYSLEKVGYYSVEPQLLWSGVNGFLSTILDRSFSAIWPQFSEGLIAELRICELIDSSKR